MPDTDRSRKGIELAGCRLVGHRLLDLRSWRRPCLRTTPFDIPLTRRPLDLSEDLVAPIAKQVLDMDADEFPIAGVIALRMTVERQHLRDGDQFRIRGYLLVELDEDGRRHGRSASGRYVDS
ncbi:hypothetical protein [Pelagibacterium halotolerans]|uniref:hypothetical protein n=1 Tax=Pelagibacterium halotolerans TaxID=531813 RepID=UPI0011D19864|nr:hypothetical protein [Pelagibacterium halotolerans]